MKRKIFHPFLFGAYSVLTLYAQNMDRVDISTTFRLHAAIFFVVSTIMILLRLLTKNWHTAGLICSLTIILFTTFTPIYDFLQRSKSIHPIFRQADVLTAVWASVFILLTWWLIRKLKHPILPNEVLNIVSIVLIMFPILRIGWSSLQPVDQPQFVSAPTEVGGGFNVSADSIEGLPDVYYIILDEYGRADVLNELMDYDNSDLINFLTENGFFVAEHSSSNYNITLLSLASSLNSTYLSEYISSDIQDDSTHNKIIWHMIRENRAKKIFQEAGYRFVSFPSGYSLTEFPKADFYRMPDFYLNNFEVQYLDSTMLSLAMDNIFGARSRTLITNAFDQLAKMPEIATDKPKFVFAHIQAAHVPFVFGPNGENVNPWAFSTTNGEVDNDHRTYVTAYRDQITYVNQLLKSTIDSILSKSKRKVIIVIQSDHGPESQLDWFSLENTCIKERMSIINAYYFPDSDKAMLYSSITPVNTFPLIYNHYLGMDEDILPDRSYFSLWDKSYEFIDVTDKLDTCKPR